MAAASSQLSVRGNDGGVIPRACGHLHARTCSARKGCGTQRALSMAVLAMVTVIIVTTITIAIVTITICTITGMSCPQVTWIDSNPGLVTSEAVQAVRAGDSGQWRVAGACAAALPLPSAVRELTSPAGGRLSHVARCGPAGEAPASGHISCFWARQGQASLRRIVWKGTASNQDTSFLTGVSGESGPNTSSHPCEPSHLHLLLVSDG